MAVLSNLLLGLEIESARSLVGDQLSDIRNGPHYANVGNRQLDRARSPPRRQSNVYNVAADACIFLITILNQTVRNVTHTLELETFLSYRT